MAPVMTPELLGLARNYLAVLGKEKAREPLFMGVLGLCLSSFVTNLVEPAGIEPASANPPLPVLRV